MTAQFSKNKNWYAIKEINKVGLLKHKTGFSMLYAELDALKRLQHPFVVKCHFAFNDVSNCYFVFDLKVGADLRHYLRKKLLFEEVNVAFYVACISSALHYCHSRNVIHRDVKPENIILDEYGFPHLVDFGVSHVQNMNNSQEVLGCSSPNCTTMGTRTLASISSSTLSGTVGSTTCDSNAASKSYTSSPGSNGAGSTHRSIQPVLTSESNVCKCDRQPTALTCKLASGTKQYLAPEVFTTKHIHGPEVDFWALGVVAYELLNGRRPFDRHVHKSMITFVENGYERQLQKNAMARTKAQGHFMKSLSSPFSPDSATANRSQSIMEPLKEKANNYTTTIPVQTGSAATEHNANVPCTVPPNTAAEAEIEECKDRLESCSAGTKHLWERESSHGVPDSPAPVSPSRDNTAVGWSVPASHSNSTPVTIAFASLSYGSPNTAQSQSGKGENHDSPDHDSGSDSSRGTSIKTDKEADDQSSTNNNHGQSKSDNYKAGKTLVFPQITTANREHGPPIETVPATLNRQAFQAGHDGANPSFGIKEIDDDEAVENPGPIFGEHWNFPEDEIHRLGKGAKLKVDVPSYNMWLGNISKECVDCIGGLFDIRPGHRLGGRNIHALRLHPWLINHKLTDWNFLRAKSPQCAPHFMPGKSYIQSKYGKVAKDNANHEYEEDRPLTNKEKAQFRDFAFGSSEHSIYLPATDGNKPGPSTASDKKEAPTPQLVAPLSMSPHATLASLHRDIHYTGQDRVGKDAAAAAASAAAVAKGGSALDDDTDAEHSAAKSKLLNNSIANTKAGQRRVESGRTLHQLEQEDLYGRRATGGISSKLGGSLFKSKANTPSPSSIAGQQARKRYAARAGASVGRS